MKVVALFSLETKELLFVVPHPKWAPTQHAFYLAFDPTKIFEQTFESLSMLQDFLAVPTAKLFINGKFTYLMDMDELPMRDLKEGNPSLFPVDENFKYLVPVHKETTDPDYLSTIYVVPANYNDPVCETPI